MAKQIVYGDQARQAVLRGINQLADAVNGRVITQILAKNRNAAMPAGGMGAHMY